MTLRPAYHSTDDPPTPIHDPLLREYIYALRRRIEIQDIQLTELATQINSLQTEIDKLTLDLHFAQHDKISQKP